MFLLALILAASSDVRSEAIEHLNSGRPAHAEVLLLKHPEAASASPDVLLAARLMRQDSAGAALVLAQLVDWLGAGGVPCGPMHERWDAQHQLAWSWSPLVCDGARRDQIIAELGTGANGSPRAEGVRGAIRSILTGELDPAAHGAPSIWRNAALALAGNGAQRKQARVRLHSDAAQPMEMAWRLYVIGRSHLLEQTSGDKREGLVHLARIAAEEPLRTAHPRLALHALDVLIEQAPVGTAVGLIETRSRLQAQLTTRLEMNE
ncbi:MAG: hypothetical protein MK101_07830 [Phycisphaerales bacterium]|nr:hypothetical protein [Phycisphaerales bacterium]